jgi:hypothetical protein
MPDFTLCQRSSCPQAKICYRFLAEPNPHWQSYSEFIGMCNEEDQFHYYMKVRPTDKLRSDVKVLENNIENTDLTID